MKSQQKYLVNGDIRDVDILSAVSEDILGPIIEESIDRQKEKEDSANKYTSVHNADDEYEAKRQTTSQVKDTHKEKKSHARNKKEIFRPYKNKISGTPLRSLQEVVKGDIKDADIISAVSEDILGHIIEESIKRKKKVKASANKYEATPNTALEYEAKRQTSHQMNDTHKRKKYPAINKNPTYNPKRPITMVESLHADLANMLSAKPLQEDPLQRISNGLRNILTSFLFVSTGARHSKPIQPIVKDGNSIPVVPITPQGPKNLPLPVSPLLPLDQASPFSPGVQILMQYVAFILGGAVLLAIPG